MNPATCQVGKKTVTERMLVSAHNLNLDFIVPACIKWVADDTG